MIRRRKKPGDAMLRALLFLTLPLVALAGCSPPPPPWAFNCPAPNTLVRYDDTRSLRAVRRDGNACIYNDAANVERRFVWGMIEEAGLEGRGHLAGLDGFFPAAPASQAQYRATVVSEGSGIRYDFPTMWNVAQVVEPVTTPAGTFQATVLVRRVRAEPPNDQSFVLRYWIDRASNVVVKRTVEMERGSTLLRAYQATTLERPTPPTPRQ